MRINSPLALALLGFAVRRSVLRAVSDRADDFQPLAGVAARYILVVADPPELARAMERNSRLLIQSLVDMEIRGLAVSLLSAGGGVGDPARTLVGTLAFLPLLIDHPRVPIQSRCLAIDLAHHLIGLSSRNETGELQVSARAGAGPRVDAALAEPAEPARTWYAYPEEWSSASASKCKDACYVEVEMDAAERCRTFSINKFYGHEQILRDYCGIAFPLPINGQVQHGWTPPGYATIVGHDPAQDVALVWSRPPPTTQQVWHAIGAPYLYLTPGSSLPAENALLAIPSHGIEKHPVRGGWQPYADWLQGVAHERKFDRVTACLHASDYACRAAFESRGIRVVSCGAVTDLSFLRRMRSFIRQHACVTTNRVGTAAFYALLDRQVFMGGPLMGTDPPDRGEELTGDLDWTRANFPKLFTADERGSVDHAREELGTRHKRDPQELRKLLFGWYTG